MSTAFIVADREQTCCNVTADEAGVKRRHEKFTFVFFFSAEQRGNETGRFFSFNSQSQEMTRSGKL